MIVSLKSHRIESIEHMKAIIIARVSTEEQREAGNSLPAPYFAYATKGKQVARLERYY